jgi:hypothetical protein
MIDRYTASISDLSRGKTVRSVEVLGKYPDSKDTLWATNFYGKRLKINFMEGSCILIDPMWVRADFDTQSEADIKSDRLCPRCHKILSIPELSQGWCWDCRQSLEAGK